MKGMQRRLLARPLQLRRRVLAFAAPAVVFALGTALTIAGLGSEAMGALGSSHARSAKPQNVAVRHDASVRHAGGLAPARRWPSEIEQLLSSSASPLGDDADAPPTVQTDQRCSRVEDGLAHCVMLECQTAGGRTACFEMVVTARRLREAPDAMRDEDHEAVPGAFLDPIQPTSSL